LIDFLWSLGLGPSGFPNRPFTLPFQKMFHTVRQGSRSFHAGSANPPLLCVVFSSLLPFPFTKETLRPHQPAALTLPLPFFSYLTQFDCRFQSPFFDQSGAVGLFLLLFNDYPIGGSIPPFFLDDTARLHLPSHTTFPRESHLLSAMPSSCPFSVKTFFFLGVVCGVFFSLDRELSSAYSPSGSVQKRGTLPSSPHCFWPAFRYQSG